MDCLHKDLQKFGRHRNGNQRFRCKECGKTITTDLSTKHSKKRDIVRAALVRGGKSLRSIAKDTGINLNTICKVRKQYSAEDLMIARFQSSVDTEPQASRILPEPISVAIFRDL